MHREFLKLLDKATGVSEYVIVVNVDIRNFTSFCQSVDSVDVATFIKKIYSKIINSYFKKASYYKPTGDGLIIIIPFSEENLEEIANSTLESCVELLKNFGSLCNKEAMITYPTPQKIGIGVTRGSACCIRTEDKIMDYSGRILNLAARLMDLARPSGVVLDQSFDLDLLRDDIKELFSEDSVCIRSVAEEEPMRIYFTKEHTLIPDSYHYPLREPEWDTITNEHSFKTLRKIRNFTVKLNKKPLDKDKIRVECLHDKPGLEGEFQTRHIHYFGSKAIEFEKRGNRYYVTFKIQDVITDLEKAGITDDMKIQIDVIYPTK